MLVPNEHELAQLAGAPAGERPPAELAALARSVAAGAVVVTLGARGALVVPADGPVLLQAPPPVHRGRHHRGRRLLLRRARPGPGRGARTWPGGARTR